MIKKTPVPICGLALGLAAVGNLLGAYGQGIRYMCGIISFLIIILFTLKALTQLDTVRKELENPVAFSVLPTYTMAIMLLCVYVKPFIGQAAFFIWLAALIAQFVIVICFIKTFVLKHNIKTVFPSWFIVFVGFVIVSVTSPAMNMKPLGQALFYAGFVFYILLLPFVVYRVFVVKQIPEPALPSMAIFSAPASLCLAGYLSAFDQKSTVLVYVILALCLISYIAVLASLFKLLRLKFYPSFSAFTFPLAISAVALGAAGNFLGENILPSFIPLAAMIIAVVITAYVLIKYIIFLSAS